MFENSCMQEQGEVLALMVTKCSPPFVWAFPLAMKWLKNIGGILHTCQNCVVHVVFLDWYIFSKSVKFSLNHNNNKIRAVFSKAITAGI